MYDKPEIKVFNGKNSLETSQKFRIRNRYFIMPYTSKLTYMLRWFGSSRYTYFICIYVYVHLGGVIFFDVKCFKCRNVNIFKTGNNLRVRRLSPTKKNKPFYEQKIDAV